MSSLNIPPSARKALIETLSTRPYAGKPLTPQTNTFQDVLHLFGKPAEITTKLVGQLLTDDPKYDGILDSSNYWNQVGPFNLFEDLGINEENLGTWGPVFAAVLGLGAEVLNPLDPFNKFRGLGTLTKRGVAGKYLADALEAGAVSSRLIGNKAFPVLDTLTLSKRLRSLRQDLKTLKEAKADSELIRRTEKEVGRLGKALEEKRRANQMLVKLYREGLDPDKVRLAESAAERARRGQQVTLGLSSPLRFDQLDFLGINKSAIASAPVSVPFFRGANAAVLGAAEAAAKAIGKGAQAFGSKIAEFAGYAPLRTEKLRTAVKVARNIAQAARGEQEITATMLEAFVRENRLDPEEAREVIEALEDFYLPEKRAMGEILSDLQKRGWPKAKEVEPQVVYKAFQTSTTKEQKTLLSPSGLGPEDATALESELRREAGTPFANSSSHSVTLTPGYVAIDVPPRDAKKLRNLNDVFGFRVWDVVETEQGRRLVARRMPSASPINEKNPFLFEHYHNLGVQLAQLARRGWAVDRLDISDILISPFGGVQIINPKKLKFVGKKKAKQLLTIARRTLADFADTFSDIPKGPHRNILYLRGEKAAAILGKDYTKAFTWRAPRALGDAENILRGNAHHLLEDAVNTAVERAILRSEANGVPGTDLAFALDDLETFLSTQRITRAREEIRGQILKGEKPVIPPIEVGVDAHGNLYVVRGKEYLTAAILEGMDNVPISRVNLAGQTLKKVEDSTYFVEQAYTLSDAFDYGKTTANRNVLGHLRPFISPDYKIVQREGSKLKHYALPNNPHLLVTSNKVIDGFLGSIFGQGVTTAANPAQAILGGLAEQLGKEAAARLFVLKAMAESEDAASFLATLLREPGLANNPVLLEASRNLPLMQQRWGFRGPALFHSLNALSGKRVLALPEIQLADDRFLRELVQPGETLVYLDRNRDLLHVFTRDEAFTPINSVRVALSDFPDSQKLLPSGRVVVTNVETGDVATFTMRDVFPEIGESLKRLSFSSTKVRFEPWRVEELRAKGVYVLSSKPKPKELEEFKEALGIQDGIAFGPHRTTELGRMEFERSISYPFVMTPDGDIIVSTRHSRVDDLLKEVFGDGPQFFSESGVISRGLIVLNNPLGSLISEIRLDQLDPLLDRLHFVAQRFMRLGLRGGNKIDVNVPFGEYIWRRLVPEWRSMTLYKLRDLKFNYPEELVGMKLDLNIETIDQVVEVRPPRVGPEGSAKQKIFDYVRNLGDEDAYKAFQEGLDFRYFTGHYARIATPEFRDALHILWDKAKSGEGHVAKVIRNLEAVFQRRQITDLTTVEMNRLAPIIQKELGEGKSIDDVLSDIITFAAQKFEKSLDPDLGRWLIEVTSHMDGAQYWIEAPEIVAQIRHAQTTRAIARSQQLKVMEEAGAVVSLSPSDYAKLRAEGFRPLEEIRQREQEVLSDIAEVENRIEEIRDAATATGDPILAELENTREKLQQRLASIRAQEISTLKQMERTDMLRATAVDVHSGTVFIPTEVAEDLLNRGILDPAHLPDGYGTAETLVEVPFERYADQLMASGTRVYLFVPEAKGVMQRLFKLKSLPEHFEKFLNFWDKVHDMFRAWTLFPIPQYHVRNAFSNTVLAWLGGVTDIRDYEEAMWILRKVHDFRMGRISFDKAKEILTQTKLTNLHGQEVTAFDIFSEWLKRGGGSGAFFYNEWSEAGKLLRGSDLSKLAHRSGLLPASMAVGAWSLDNPVIRGGIRVAASIENPFRLAAFLKGWRETGLEAGELLMKKVFYDYSDLSMFERNVLRRIVPFYSWLRHNIPRMLQTMALHPEIHLRLFRFAHTIEQGALDNRPPQGGSMAQWMKDAFGLVVYSAHGQNFVKFGEGLLPMTDVLGLVSGKGFREVLTGGITPFLKVPLEHLFNMSLFTGAEIDRLKRAGGAEPSRSTALATAGFTRGISTKGPLGVLNIVLNDHLFKSFYRLGKVAIDVLDSALDKRNWINGSPSVGAVAWILTLGKGMVVDPARMRANLRYKWTQRKAAFDRVIDYYESQGLKTIANAVRDMKLYAMLQVGDLETF